MEHQTITLDAFTTRFAAEMIWLAGLVFWNGAPVETYARAAAKFYWLEPLCREQGPEACAGDDFLALQVEGSWRSSLQPTQRWR